MSEVDIKTLENEKEIKQVKVKKIKFPKIKGKKTINNISNESHNFKYVPDELQQSTIVLALKALSIPAKQKSNILFQKMATSNFMVSYLNKYLLIDNLQMLNDHVKFALVYGLKLTETLMISNVENIISNSNNNIAKNEQ